jgi:predicted MFS family arabinose efflux permease
MFGWLAATVSLAAALGPPLGGELLHSFSWRALFGAQLVLFCITAVLLALAWPGGAEAQPLAQRAGAKARFDVAGALLMAVGLAPLLFADRAQWPWALGASAFVLVLFVIWERRCQRPLFDLQLFRLPGFAVGTSATALQSSLFYGLLSLLPIYFQRVLGQSPSVVGRTLFALMGAVFVTAPLGGRLCDRLGPRRTAFIGLGALLVGLALLQRLAAWTSAADAIPALIGVGSGFGLLNAPLQTATLGAVPAERAGSAAGVAFTLRYFGGVLGMFMLRVLLEAPSTGDAAGELLAHQGAAHGLLASGLVLALVAAGLPQRPVRAKR